MVARLIVLATKESVKFMLYMSEKINILMERLENLIVLGFLAFGCLICAGLLVGLATGIVRFP